MKNRINLYTTEVQPKLQILSLSTACMLWAGTAVLMLISALYLTNKNVGLQEDSAAGLSYSAEQSAQITSASTKMAARTKDPHLVDSIEKKEILLRLKQRVLDELAGQENLKSLGFSGLMLDLARQHEDGIWLTRIRLNEQDISIQGGALKSASVPKWLDKLGTSGYFKGKEFATTRMYRDSEQQLFFELGSQLNSLKAGESVNER